MHDIISSLELISLLLAAKAVRDIISALELIYLLLAAKAVHEGAENDALACCLLKR